MQIMIDIDHKNEASGVKSKMSKSTHRKKDKKEQNKWKIGQGGLHVGDARTTQSKAEDSFESQLEGSIVEELSLDDINGNG